MSVKVFRSAIIDAPAAEVWHLLRDFNGHDKWHPAVAMSHMELGDPSDLVGAVRAFRLQDGGFLREQLLSLSDRDMAFSYCILEAPIPLHDYVAHLRLRPVTDGNRCFIAWESSFDPPAAEAQSLTQLVAVAIYESGIAALQAHFGGGKSNSPRAIEIPRAAAPAEVPATAAISQAPQSAGTIRTQAIIVRRHGEPDVLEPAEIEVPPPGPGEIRVRHGAIGVNFLDVHCRAGDFPMLSLPGIPGAEGAGTITEIGAGVTHLRPGMRIVYAGMPLGSYAGDRVLPAEIAVPLPHGVDDRLAASAFLKGLMADALVYDVHSVNKGEQVFVRAAAGGVGTLLCQMARLRGAHVIGAVSSPEKIEAARAAGCHHVVVSSGADGLHQLTGRVDVVFDGVGAATYESSLSLLAPRGHLVVYGQSSGSLGARNLDALAEGALTLSRPNLAHYLRDRTEIEARAARLFDLLSRRDLHMPISVFPLGEAADAHRQLAARANIGAIILIP